MKRMSLALLALLVAVAVVLGGCARATPTPAPKPTPAPAATPAPGVATPIATATPSPVTIELMTGPLGTLAYVVMFQYAKVVKEAKHPWLTLSVMETSGADYMTRALASESARWSNTAIITGETTLQRFTTEFPDLVPALKQTRYAFNYSIAGPMFFHTFDSKIRTPQDMVGKKIGIGKKPQAFWGTMAYAQLQAWGIADKVKVEWLGPDVASKALIDGAVDVATSGVYAGIGKDGAPQAGLPLTEAYGTGRTTYIIAPPREEAGKAQALVPGSQVICIPAGSLKAVEKEACGLGEAYTVSVHEGFAEYIVYEMTRQALERYLEVQPVHSLAKLFNPATFPFGLTKNLHPGALRAYQDWAKANPNHEAISYYKEWGIIK